MFSPAVTGSLLTGNYTSRLLSWAPYSSKGHSLSGWVKHTQTPDWDLSTASQQPATRLLLMCPRTNASDLNFPHQTDVWLSLGCLLGFLLWARSIGCIDSWTCVGYAQYVLGGKLTYWFNSNLRTQKQCVVSSWVTWGVREHYSWKKYSKLQLVPNGTLLKKWLWHH